MKEFKHDASDLKQVLDDIKIDKIVKGLKKNCPFCSKNPLNSNYLTPEQIANCIVCKEYNKFKDYE
jgi:uncharacterized protein (DUF983 family)